MRVYKACFTLCLPPCPRGLFAGLAPHRHPHLIVAAICLTLIVRLFPECSPARLNNGRKRKSGKSYCKTKKKIMKKEVVGVNCKKGFT